MTSSAAHPVTPQLRNGFDYSELELHAVALANGDTSQLPRIAELLTAVAERGRALEYVSEALHGSQGVWADDWLNDLARRAGAALQAGR